MILLVPHLPIVLKSAKNRCTGFTASILMLGRKVAMPVYLIFPGPEAKHNKNIEQYILKFVEKMQSAHNNCTINSEVGDYDSKTVSPAYKVRDAVCVFDSAYVKGRCRELSPTWKGPGIFTPKFSDYY